MGYGIGFLIGVGGNNAVSYLMKVKNYSFLEAIQTIMNKAQIQPPVIMKQEKICEKRELELPEKAENNNRVKVYLSSRGIALDIINECIANGFIYESASNHNVVFVGFDDNNKPKYAFYRGTNTTRFMGEAKGSDKRYSFKLNARNQSNRVHLFESAIDLLSYATLLKLKNIDWHNENLISLGGVYQAGKDVEKSKIPTVVQRFLEQNPNIDEVYLHLDNDEVR